ncbi:sigma-70 family RNA polymerase sigma factor [Kitasatospora sp. NPDC094015]|uniref:RNA polymerase sigma factor n=1 Tax=Kitasatospora sp. NPDC094015 TaxID=3155205 RepID=UPI00331D4201
MSTLIDHARAGDPVAWSEFYLRYRAPLVSYLLRRTNGDRALAEDLTQETFVRAMRAIRGYRWTGTDFSAWLMTIARNLLNDHSRRAMNTEIPVLEVPERDSGVSVEGLVISAFESAESTARLEFAMTKLTRAQREALRMRYWDGLTAQQISQRTGKGVGAIKTLGYRARVRLRQELAQCP